MKFTWAFQVGCATGTKYYGMEAFTYLSTEFLPRIIPKSFSGVTMRVDIVSRLVAPNTVKYSISNTDGLLSADDLVDRIGCIVLLIDGVESRRWCLVAETAVEVYGRIDVSCVDPISRQMVGDFPYTPTLASNFPSDEVQQDEDYRVPITFGTAFIPAMPFINGSDKFHCIGLPDSYTIIKLRNPREWDFRSEWDNSYTYDQTNEAGEEVSVRGVQAIIADGDGDGTVDSSGVWSKSGRNLAPLIQFTGQYPSITHPGEFLYELLGLFAINTNYLDQSSFTAIDSALSGVTWGGGWWKSETRERLLAEMLSNCDCFLSIEDEVKLNQFSKTPVETLDRSQIVSMSFRPVSNTKSTVDGGTVKFAWDGEPQDVLGAQATVGLYDGQSDIDDPSSDVFEYRYGYDSQEAQNFGVLYFQKKFDQKFKVTFKTTLEAIATVDTLVPGQVIGIDDTPYGDACSVVITQMIFHPDSSVSITGTVYNNLEQYSDMSASALTPDTDLGSSFDFNSLTNIVTVSGENIFHFSSGVAIPVPTSVDLTATLFGDLTTYQWQYYDGADWQDLSGTIDTAVYTLAYDNAAWGTDLTLRVRCLSDVYYGEITIAKMSDGAAGEDGVDGSVGAGARTVVLTSVKQGFAYLTDGTSPTPATTEVTATAENTEDTVYYEFFLNDVSVQGPSTDDTYTYTPQASYDDMPDKVEVQIREGGPTAEPIYARDQMTMVGLKAGSDAITVILTNEAHTLSTDSAGVVDYTNGGCDIRVWIGATPIPYDGSSPYGVPSFRITTTDTYIYDDPTPSTVSVFSTNDTRRFGEPSGASQDTSFITYTIYVTNNDGNVVTITRMQSFSKSHQGVDGADGAQGDTGPSVVYVGEYTSGAVTSGYWTWPKIFYNSTIRRDIVKYLGNYYLFAGTDGATIYSWTGLAPSGDWEAFGAEFSSVATDILLAQSVIITKEMTFSSTLGGKIYVTGADGLTIYSAGGLKISAGADIYLNSASGNPAKLIWDSSTGHQISMGTDWSNGSLNIHESLGTGGAFRIGVNFSGVVDRFAIIGLYGNNIYIDSTGVVDIVGDTQTRIVTVGGGSFATFSTYAHIWANAYVQITAPYLRGVGYPNIGAPTTSYKFGYGYFVYDLSCRAITLSTSITAGGDLNCSNVYTGNVGGISLPILSLFAKTRIRLYNSSLSNYFTIKPDTMLSTGARSTSQSGYVSVDVNGATRYLRLWT